VSISTEHTYRSVTKRAELAGWPAVAVWGASAAGLVVALLALAEALPSGLAAGFVFVSTALVLSTVTVGAVLVTRLPRHIVGWLLLAGGLSLAVSDGAAALADYGLNVHPGSVPGAVWFAVVGAATGSLYIGPLAGFVPMYFPTGRLPSPRWRIVLPLAIGATVTSTIGSGLNPFTAGTYPSGVTNPLALGGSAGQLAALLNTATTILGTPALLLVIAALVVRYRRAMGIERQQLKWFAAVGLVVVPAFVLGILGGAVSSGPLADLSTVFWFVAIFGLALLPLAIGVAVLRYRLYEIDRLISRTIAYGLLTVILGALFVAVILVMQAIIAPLTGSNELAVAGSTLLVAALFQPLRRRVQRLVDRRFNRSRYDAERTVAALAARLRDEVDLDAVRSDILATVDVALEPSMSSLWLRGGPAA
jgi:hypothetical protein